MILSTLAITFLAIFGFLNAYFLNKQHIRQLKTGKEMFCLLKEDCSSVVGSKYGKTLGIKNEILGMAYYSLLIILLGINLQIVSTFITLAVTFAFVFSIYLLLVQVLILKKSCSWCFIAIIINTLIFATWMFGT